MLYIVGTPIGNLEDISYRQAKTLCESNIILTEDTRSVHSLFEKIHELFGLIPPEDQQRISYYKEKEFEKLPQIIHLLEEDKTVSLISQAGMPLVSDPGYLLVSTAIKQGLSFTVIPGSTAATTALLYSGFNPGIHMFIGFLPKKENELIKLFTKLKKVKETMPETVFIAYESPNRIQETLSIINSDWPQLQISISRELTKKFEETLRGNASDLIKSSYKGELCIVFT